MLDFWPAEHLKGAADAAFASDEKATKWFKAQASYSSPRSATVCNKVIYAPPVIAVFERGRQGGDCGHWVTSEPSVRDELTISQRMATRFF